jgi:hypothetical protein
MKITNKIEFGPEEFYFVKNIVWTTMMQERAFKTDSVYKILEKVEKSRSIIIHQSLFKKKSNDFEFIE